MTNSMVGREREHAMLVAAAHEQRWTTLVGLGGVGKTTLAQTLPSTFVQLGQVRDRHGLLEAIGRALDAARTPSDSHSLRAALRDCHLLVLDEAEHVPSGELLWFAEQLGMSRRLLIIDREAAGTSA